MSIAARFLLSASARSTPLTLFAAIQFKQALRCFSFITLLAVLSPSFGDPSIRRLNFGNAANDGSGQSIRSAMALIDTNFQAVQLMSSNGLVHTLQGVATNLTITAADGSTNALETVATGVAAIFGTNNQGRMVIRTHSIIGGATNYGGGFTLYDDTGTHNPFDFGFYQFGAGIAHDGLVEFHSEGLSVRPFAGGEAPSFFVRNQDDTGSWEVYIDRYGQFTNQLGVATPVHSRIANTEANTNYAMGFWTGGNNPGNLGIWINVNGKVGIGGITAPAEDMDISSNLLVRGTLKAATVYGTNNTLYGSPTITNFNAATHTHVDAANGGPLSADAIASGILPQSRGGTGTATSPAQGAILFGGSGSAYASDDAHLHWDDAQGRFSIGINNPTNAFAAVDLNSGILARLMWSGAAFENNGAGFLQFGANNGGTNFVLGRIISELTDGTAGAQKADIVFQVIDAGSFREAIRIGNHRLNFSTIPVYANNAAAISGGLVAGDVYRTNGDPDPLCIVH